MVISFQKNSRNSANINIKQAVLSSCYKKSNGQVETDINVLKQTLKRYKNTNADPHIVMLMIRSAPY